MNKRRFKTSSDQRDATDEPPMSRLFVVCSKTNSEKDFHDSFARFGTIEEVRLLKDRDGSNKGVAYVKFSKTSEAATACETLNGQTIGNSARPVKVLIAASRQMGQASAKSRDGEKAQRLFIITPKDFSKDQLYEEFSQYGPIEDVSVLKDRHTREGKGFAYIKFKKFSSAALAFENCDGKYRAVFAEPKPSRSSSSDGSGGSNNYADERHSNPLSVLPGVGLSPEFAGDNDCVLHVICSPMITHDQLWRLFDIVPNMDYCKMNSDFDISSNATVVYRSPQAAFHARQKLHGFEYPPGERLIVKLGSELKNFSMNDGPSQTLFEGGNSTNSSNFCSVILPPVQPLSKDATVAQRCFIVCSPHTLPVHVLKQVFCRFGNLIDVYLLNNRNCGYAKYSSGESAKQAMSTLHGAEIYGVRLKVLEAEEQKSEQTKRSRTDD